MRILNTKTLVFVAGMYACMLPIFSGTTFAQNQKDLLVYLEDFQIGSELSPVILKLGSLTNSVTVGNDLSETYTFTSVSTTHPHIIKFENKRAVFIQITIPPDRFSEFNTKLERLGKSEITLPKTKSEILIGFPSLGEAFIKNGYNNQVMRYQKYRVKTHADFIRSEGRNFLPVENKPDLAEAVIQASPSSPTISPAHQNFKSPKVYSYIMIIGLFLIAILLIFVITKIKLTINKKRLRK